MARLGPGLLGLLGFGGSRNWARRPTFRYFGQYFGQYFGRHLGLGRGFGAAVDEAITRLMGDVGTAFDRRVVAALVNYLDNHGGRAEWDQLTQGTGTG